MCAMGGGVAAAEPGDHIRLGAAEVVPTIQVASAWNSNVYLQEANETSGLALKLSPGFGLELDGNAIDINMSGSYSVRHYLQSQLSNLNQYSESAVDFELGAFENSTIGIELSDGFEISTHATEATYAERALITHLSNNAAGAISYHPGGALDVDLGGHFSYDNYFTPQEASLANANANLNSKVHFGPKLDMKWAFFPKTALVLNASTTWFDWDQNLVVAKGDQTGSAQDLGAWLAVPDGSNWRVSGGLIGRFTNKLVLNLVGGYGSMTYDEQSVIDYQGNTDATAAEVVPTTVGFDADLSGFPNGLIAKVQLEWKPTFSNTFTMGYRKDFEDSWFSNYLTYHYGFVRHQLLLGARLGLTNEFGYRIESYAGEVTRTDQVLRAQSLAQYGVSDWMTVELNGRWIRRLNPDSPMIEYDDLSATLSARFSY